MPRAGAGAGKFWATDVHSKDLQQNPTGTFDGARTAWIRLYAQRSRTEFFSPRRTLGLDFDGATCAAMSRSRGTDLGRTFYHSSPVSAFSEAQGATSAPARAVPSSCSPHTSSRLELPYRHMHISLL